VITPSHQGESGGPGNGRPGTPSQTPSGPGAGSSAQPAPAGGGQFPGIDGVTTAIEEINAARLHTQDPPLLVVQLSAVWGGGWFYLACVLDSRTWACRGFALHRVPHRGLIESALDEALGDNGPGPTPVVFCPRCREAELSFPAWARASAVEVAACDSFTSGLRERLTIESERGFRSRPEIAQAARDWIERTYNPAREADRLEPAA
jgi:hypothetical protein